MSVSHAYYYNQVRDSSFFWSIKLEELEAKFGTTHFGRINLHM